MSLTLDDLVSFPERVSRRCRENSTALNAMIGAFSDDEKLAYDEIDFSKPEWWEE